MGLPNDHTKFLRQTSCHRSFQTSNYKQKGSRILINCETKICGGSGMEICAIQKFSFKAD